MKAIHLAAIILASTTSAFAATYYVDFAAGNNEADGLSPRTAWQHSPGDVKATGKPAVLTLQAGDTVRFKGGVHYFGEISLRVSGSEGKPITLDGNADGSFGEGPAILDGAQMITDWKRVSSAEQAGGNPRWQELVYTDLDVDLASNFSQESFVLHRERKPDRQAPWQRLFLIDGERGVLPIAQSPNPSDPFYPDLPADFHESPQPVVSNYPHKVYYEKGSRGNKTLPLLAITYGGGAPVLEPFNGGAISVEMDAPAEISEIGFTLHRPKTNLAPEQIVFLADGEEVYEAEVDPQQTEMQRFELLAPVEARKLTFRLQHAYPSAPGWTKLEQIAAFTSDGDNVIKRKVSSVIQDKARFTQADPGWYDDVFIGVHGGNNHVYFARVQGYDPAEHQLQTPHFSSQTYPTTKYALYNSPKFIDLPGEWCLVPREEGGFRAFHLPKRLEDGEPVNVGYPTLKTAITLRAGVSHIDIRGFLMQRYAGGFGGVATHGSGVSRPAHIRISDCEVRFMSAKSGISLNHSEHVTVENCYIHHCPGWTVGIYVNRVKHYRIIGNRLDTNSGSGIRHYDSRHGELKNNAVLNHYGMHSSGLNFYEGCAEILFEGNYVQNVIAINRSAKDLTFRNNVVDSEGRNPVSLALWKSGRIGGTFIKNIVFENNTFINGDKNADWSTAVFVQAAKSAPEGLVIRNNILDRLRPPVPGIIENNLFTRETSPDVTGSGSQVIEDATKLFIAPEKGDFRRKPGGPMMAAGANVPPPSAEWSRRSQAIP